MLNRLTVQLAAGATLLLACHAASAQFAADLFFSEYVEGSSNNKAIEIYNGTGAAVDLSQYTIELYTNGGTSVNQSFTAAPGTLLANGDVFVIRNGSATLPGITGEADATSSITNYNGDDALLLKKAGAVIDRIGQLGNDPGSEWGSGLTSTQDNTLVRKVSICAGDSDSGAAFDPSAEWDGFAIDVTSLGSHSSDCPPRFVVADANVTEGNSGTVTLSFTVTLSAATGGAVSVDFATADGSATAGVDYLAAAGTLNFDGNAGETRQIVVTVNGDTDEEGDETFTLTLGNPSLTGVLLDSATGTIVGDDVPKLSVADVAGLEGDSGTSVLRFTLVLDSAAGPSGASVAYATADVSALAGSDYLAASGTASFAAGETEASVDITLNGDSDVEPNETFELRLSAPVGLLIVDDLAVGTVQADDFDAISGIQGNGPTSPRVGETVLVRGLVTSRVSNGFFVQSQASDEDGDPMTSEGLFVFTGSPPSATDVQAGHLVQVAGTVAEFVPSSDPNQQGQTQLSSATVTLITPSVGLPAPVALSTSLPVAGGAIDQLEHLENMRVTADSFTVVAPTDGNTSETNATSSSNGRFSVVVTGTSRPFREPGLEPEDAVGQPASIPVWDGNAERFTVESVRARSNTNGNRAPIDVDVGATLTGLTGVLDYSFRSYRIALDFDAAPLVSAGRQPAAVSAATGEEYTIGTYNLERFFDDVNDPAIGEPVLTTQAFANRLNKASLGIREFMGTPDIIGIVEIENLSTLQALAAKISSDAQAAGQPDPQYLAFLEEGNDVGGIDVGFLVKSAAVSGSTPRVAVNSVTQFGKDTLLKCPDGQDNTGSSLLNDRPPLLLEATVTAPNGASQAVTVVVNHLRSLGSVNSADPDSTACPGVAFPSTGERVRRKRQQQAEFVANLVQGRQQADPAENIVLVGDFNAFEFNDGFGDLVGTLLGTPAANEATLVGDDGIDLVDPDLINLNTTVDPAERYSFVFGGNAQNLDHVIVNAAINLSATPRLEHARINADFAEDNRADAAIALRLADHDPAVAFFRGPGFGVPELVYRDGFEGAP